MIVKKITFFNIIQVLRNYPHILHEKSQIKILITFSDNTSNNLNF